MRIQLESGKPRVVLHLGMPKTATTMLQNSLFARHSQILHLGKCDDWLENPQRAGHWRTQPIRRFVEELRVAETGRVPELPEGGRFRSEAEAAGKTLVWSLELMTAGSPGRKRARAEALRRAFGEARVLIVLRNPFSFITSYYFQKVKDYNRLDSVEQGHWMASLPQRPYRFSMEQFLGPNLEQSRQPALMHLNIEETIAAFAAEFGRGRIRLMLFEQLLEDQAAFLEELSRFFGVDPAESLRLVADSRRNDRWTERHMEILDRLQNSRFGRWRFGRVRSKAAREALLGMTPGHSAWNAPAAKVEIPPHWREQIEEFTRGPLTRLAAEFDLPLAKYGYPVDPPAEQRRAA